MHLPLDNYCYSRLSKGVVALSDKRNLGKSERKARKTEALFHAQKRAHNTLMGIEHGTDSEIEKEKKIVEKEKNK